MLWRGREYIVPTTRSAKALVSGGGACCGGEGSIMCLPQGPLATRVAAVLDM